jgi:hypothetical protein
VSFQTAGSPVLTGVADWHKLANAPRGRYPAAIQTRASIVGSHFEAPAANTPALASGPRQVTLSAGDLSSAISEVASFLTPNHFNFASLNSNSLALSFNAATGVVTGSFLDPGTGKTIAIHGVLLQDDDIGAGYFLGPDESGSFELSAPQ